MFFAVFLGLIASYDYTKTICACQPAKCIVDNELCFNQPSIDPTSLSFADDFNTLRKNIKDVNLIFNNRDALEVGLDMRVIAGLNINFSSTSSKVNLNLKYVVNFDYGGNNFKFDSNCEATFIPIQNSATSSSFKIDSIIAIDSTVVFELNNGKRIDLYFRSLVVKSTTLSNVAGLYKTQTGLISIRADKGDTFELDFKVKDSKMTYNDNVMAFSYKKTDELKIEGESELGAHRGQLLKVIINSDVDLNSLPLFSFSFFNDLEFIGKLWKPSESRPIRNLTGFDRINSPAGDFPFSILASQTTLVVNGNMTIYGDIDSEDWAFSEIQLKVETTLKTPCLVKFDGYYDGDLFASSPYISYDFKELVLNYTNPLENKRQFPIRVCFNEYYVSHITAQTITTNVEKLTIDTIVFYPSILKDYTDDEIENLPVFKNGFYFLDIPLNFIKPTEYVAKVDLDSPSAIVSTPGFDDDNFCFAIKKVVGERLQLRAYKSKSAYDAPIYLCITDGKSRCYTPTVWSDPYINVTGIKDGDISKSFPAGFTDLTIQARVPLDSVITIDFDKLPRTNYNITIIGLYDDDEGWIVSQFQLKNNKKNVANLSLSNLKLIETMEFNVQYLDMKGVSFATGKTFKFNTAIVTTDVNSIDSLNTVDKAVKISELNLVHNKFFLDNDGSFSKYKESITIDNDKMMICIIGVQRRPPEPEYCAEFDSTNYGKFNYLSLDPLSITCKSMTPAFRPVNITISPVPISKAYDIKLYGSGWNKSIKNKFRIKNDKPGLIITVSAPGQAGNFMFTGESFLFVAKYGSPANTCVFIPNQTKTCHRDYGKYEIENNDTAATELAAISKDALYITFDHTDKTFFLSNDFFDSKQISLNSFSQTPNQNIGVNFTGKPINRIYSSTTLNNINLVYDGSKEETVYFGQLKLGLDFETDANWKKYVNLYASQLICSYQDLYKFNKITMDDQLNLTGDLPTEGEEKVIKFVKDDDANDLVAHLNTKVIDIKITPDTLTIGKIRYELSNSDNYDAYFMIKTLGTEIQVNIDCDPSVTVDTFVRFVIECSSKAVNFTFTGKFPEQKTNEKSLIQLFKSSNLFIKSSIDLPISIINCAKVTINFTSKDVKKIQGPIEFYGRDLAEPKIKFFNSIDPEILNRKIDLVIVNGMTLENQGTRSLVKIIGLMSPDIHVTINKIIALPRSVNNITVFNTIGNTGSSKVVFVEALPKGIIFDRKTYVITKVRGKIQNEDDFPFISTNETMMEARTEDLEDIKFTFKYIYDPTDDITHGFTPDVNYLDVHTVEAKEGFMALQLYARIKPSLLPYIIDIVNKETADTGGELIINEDNFDDLNKLNDILPIKYAGIIFRLYRDLPENIVLDVNSIDTRIQKVSIEIKSMDRLGSQITVSLPAKKEIALICDNVILKFNVAGSNEMVADYIDFVDCQFANAKDIKIGDKVGSVTLDVDSLNGLANIALTSYPNKLSVNSANVVTFTKEGWMFREDLSKDTTLIKAKEFSNVEFETNKFCLLLIEDLELTEIQSFKFNALPTTDGDVYFEIQGPWGKITNFNGFMINVIGAIEVNLNSATYPIPKLFNVPNSNISYQFRKDMHGKFDTITLKDGYVYKDESFRADFTFLTEEYQVVKGKRVTFSGNTEFNFHNNVGTVDLEEAVFTDYSNASFSKLHVSNKMVVGKRSNIIGDIGFSPSAVVQMRWALGEPPLISWMGAKNDVPQELEIVYTENKVDKELFKKKMIDSSGLILMRSKYDFHCDKLVNRVKYGGDFKPFGAGNQYLKLECDASSVGIVLLLKGTKEISPDDYDDSEVESKNVKLTSGSVAGIVIGCAVAVALIAAFIVYYKQRRKIDMLKNRIPAETTTAYETTKNEDDETSSVSITVNEDDEFFD